MKKVRKFSSGRALVIAVANYADVNPLPTAVLNDARDVGALLAAADYCGYDAKQIQTLLDSEATLENIRRGLGDLASRCGHDDTAVIFFSGHGARLKQGGIESSVLLPVDCHYNDLTASTLSDTELSNALSAIPASRLVVLLDACHSGGVGSLKRGAAVAIEDGFDEKALQRLAQGTGRVIIASSRATETSLVMNGARNSVFTEHLLEGLRGHARTNGDGLIRVFEVFNYVSEKVRGAVPGRQHPIFKASDLEDNFPIALNKGGAKMPSAISSVGSAPWRQLEDIMADLYPVGPTDQEIWTRAGGDVSDLQLTGTGRAQWFSALRKLRLGGGGHGISLHSLLRATLDDFPHHQELRALKNDSE